MPQTKVFTVTVDPENGEAPPSYNSLFSKLKEASVKSGNTAEYAKKSSSAVQKACGCCIAVFSSLLCCGLGLALPICQIVFGALYLNECPINYLIPIYLIVGGAFSLVSGGSTCGGSGKKWKNSVMTKGKDEKESEGEAEEGEREEEKGGSKVKKVFGVIGNMMSLFLIVWLCCGTYWTVDALHKYTPVKYLNGTSAGSGTGTVNPLYCHQTAFQFAFWLSMAQWMVVGLVIFMVLTACCCICCVRCCAKSSNS